MGRVRELGLILISLLVPSLVIGQSFEPLSHASSYTIYNGQVYFDPPTTPEPTFLERWLPFLAPMQSVNSEEVDEAIINSVSGPSPPDNQPYGNAAGYQGQAGYSSYQNPGPGPNQVQSPYLSNDEDNYLPSASANVPQKINSQPLGSLDGQASQQQYVSIPGKHPQQLDSTPGNYAQQSTTTSINAVQQSIPTYAQQPAPTSGNYPQQSTPTGSYHAPASGYNYNHIPNTQPFYSGYPYPKPYAPRPHLQNGYQMRPQVTTTESPPFYQGFLDMFGFGSGTEAPFRNPFSGNSYQFSQQLAEARKSDVVTRFEDDDLSQDTKDPEFETHAESSPDTTTTPNKDKDDFPCPKLGIWQWNGEVCIAVGPAPTWACKPNDLAQSGRLTICRNKIFFPYGVNPYEK